MLSILLDTSFLVALLDTKATHHKHAEGYFNYFVEQDSRLYLSTISIGELSGAYPLENLPIFPYFRLLPFNHTDAQLAAEYQQQYREAVRTRKKEPLPMHVRDDIKILAQGVTNEVAGFIADEALLPEKLIEVLFDGKPPFRVLSLHIPHEAAFGLTGKLF